MRAGGHRLLAGGLVVGLTLPASAQSTQTYVDLEAGLGYSSNPLLQYGDSTGAAFGRVSAYAFHGWRDERSTNSISAYVENSTYFRRYSNKQAFALSAATARSLSERVKMSANIDFRGDFGNQLSSRFYGVPAGSVPLDPTVPDGSLIVVGPDLYALNMRRYSLSGNVGLSAALTERDSITASVGAQRVFFNNNADILNYTGYDGSLGYQRKISEFVSIGVRAIATKTDYSMGRTVTSFGPQATIDARFAPNWNLSLAAGVVHTKQDFGSLGGSTSSNDLALDASVCHQLTNSRFCGRVARRSQSSILGISPTTSSVAVDYYRRLTDRDQIQLSLAATRTGRVADFGLGRQTYLTATGNYDRKFGDRMSAGLNLGARTLSIAGSDEPEPDYSASVYLRYRIGDLK